MLLTEQHCFRDTCLTIVWVKKETNKQKNVSNKKRMETMNYIELSTLSVVFVCGVHITSLFHGVKHLLL